MRNYPKVFVIVLNYNGRETIQRNLNSVFKSDWPNLEVVVVDNNSSDGSFELAKTNFSKANFIQNEENFGFAGGMNVGIRFALERMAEYVVLLNNDTEVEKDFLKNLIDVFEKNPTAGIISPAIFNGLTKEVWFSGGKIDWLQMKVTHNKKTKIADSYETGFITGCAMVVKKEVFQKIGLFDDDFFLYWEDADFCYRAKKAGFKLLIAPQSWVYHFEQSEQNKKNKTYWLVVSGLVFFKKNTPFWLRPWISSYTFLRKIKNKADLIAGKKELALMVQKAYRDFQNAKF